MGLEYSDHDADGAGVIWVPLWGHAPGRCLFAGQAAAYSMDRRPRIGCAAATWPSEI